MGNGVKEGRETQEHSQEWLCYKSLQGVIVSRSEGEEKKCKGEREQKTQEHSQEWLCHKGLQVGNSVKVGGGREEV